MKHQVQAFDWAEFPHRGPTAASRPLRPNLEKSLQETSPSQWRSTCSNTVKPNRNSYGKQGGTLEIYCSNKTMRATRLKSGVQMFPEYSVRHGTELDEERSVNCIMRNWNEDKHPVIHTSLDTISPSVVTFTQVFHVSTERQQMRLYCILTVLYSCNSIFVKPTYLWHKWNVCCRFEMGLWF